MLCMAVALMTNAVPTRDAKRPRPCVPTRSVGTRRVGERKVAFHPIGTDLTVVMTMQTAGRYFLNVPCGCWASLMRSNKARLA